MSSSVRRPVKISLRIRRNFARRDWTCIGLRGANVAARKAATRTKLEAPSSGLSYAHQEKSRSIGFREPAPDRSLVSSGRPKKDWRGWLWIGLIVSAIAAAAAQAMK